MLVGASRGFFYPTSHLFLRHQEDPQAEKCEYGIGKILDLRLVIVYNRDRLKEKRNERKRFPG